MKNYQQQEAAVVISTEECETSEAGSFRIAFSIKETAAMLGVCDKTVRRLISRGLLRPSRALRHLLISRQEIDRFLKDTAPQ
jgi:excisionase family DNA binding protein